MDSTLAGNVTDEVPGLDEIRLLALQLDHTLIRPLLKALVLVKTLLRLLVGDTNVVKESRRNQMVTSSRTDSLCKRPAGHRWVETQSGSPGTCPAGERSASQTGCPSLPRGSA